MIYKTVILLMCVCSYVVATSEGNDGDICLLPNNDEGVCRVISKCGEAVQDTKFRSATKICGFNGTEPIVCCPRKDLSSSARNCEPKSPRRPNMTYGKIAFEKCLEYQEEVVFPCFGDKPAWHYDSEGNIKLNNSYRTCVDEPPQIIGGPDGYDASRGQFPHMALLGYGDDSTTLWGCGGITISHWFILTAGHCTHHRELGQVALARLGILDRLDPTLVTRLYRIARVISHPEHRPPSKYNDIALLETDKRITFVNKFVSPACLSVEDDPEEDYFASATGWGELGHGGDLANRLQIMDLMRFSHKECSRFFGTSKRLINGIDNETQICYGHRTRAVDTCKGDSGGPLQTELKSVECMHKVIGITSFGKNCGRPGNPGVYTRVRPFVPWIESHVWTGSNRD